MKHEHRPADPVRSTGGFEQAKSIAAREKEAAEISDRIFKLGPWATTCKYLERSVRQYQAERDARAEELQRNSQRTIAARKAKEARQAA